MLTPAPALPAHLVPTKTPARRDRLVVVTDRDDVVRVQWRFGSEQPWRCGVDGRMSTTSCAHTFAAALVLAEQFLGLVRIPELHPDQETAAHVQ